MKKNGKEEYKSALHRVPLVMGSLASEYGVNPSCL